MNIKRIKGLQPSVKLPPQPPSVQPPTPTSPSKNHTGPQAALNPILSQPSSTEELDHFKTHEIEADTIDFPIFQEAVTESVEYALLNLKEGAASMIYEDLSARQTQSIKLAENLLKAHSGEAYDHLKPSQKLALLNFLVALDMDPSKLMQAEIQNRPGARDNNQVRHTGTGRFGHFVNSSMTSLNALIQDGRLEPELLVALQELHQAPLAPGLESERQQLLLSALQNVALPHTINQRSRGTCQATIVEFQMANEHPEHYVKIIQDLASPNGVVRDALLPGAAEDAMMVRERDTAQVDTSGRNTASRLVQPAFMEFANGDYDYQNTLDQHRPGWALTRGDDFSNTGLKSPHVVRLLNALTEPGTYRTIDYDSNITSEDLCVILESALSRGHLVGIGLDMPGGGDNSGHAVTLSAIDREKNLAYVINPWGELNTLDLDFLKSNLRGAQFHKSFSEDMPQIGPADATAKLTGAARDLNNYQPLIVKAPEGGFRMLGGRNSVAILKSSPEVIRTMSDTQMNQMANKMKSLGVPWSELDRVITQAEKGRVPQLLLTRLSEVDTADQGIRLLRLTQYMSTLNISDEQQAQILARRPEETLTTRQFEQLLTSLSNQDETRTQLLLNQAQSAAGLDLALSPQVVLATLQRGLEADDRDMGDLAMLMKELPPQQQGKVLNHLIENEDGLAADLLIETLSTTAPKDLQSVLQPTHPYEVGETLQNPEEAAEVLSLMLKHLPPETSTWNSLRLLEGYQKVALDENIPGQNLNAVAQGLMHRLSDAQIQALDPELKQVLVQILPEHPLLQP